MKPVESGDYVLATKYSDGDPRDNWAVGFFDRTEPSTHTGIAPRHFVVDGARRQLRGNGFRRVARISQERGAWLLKHAAEIEQSGRSVWYWKRAAMVDSYSKEPITFQNAPKMIARNAG